jgi:acyl-coenzyme A synthetase/AMP-(fatty) acid ligase/thioesterase domain-containing protein/acyl carrier protein
VPHAADPSRRTFTGTAAPLPFDTLPDAFRAAAQQHPDALAARDRDRAISYRELDRVTNRIAHAILALGDDAPLVVVAPLRVPSLALILGAVKAGRLVAPLDPRWPVDQWIEVKRRTHGHLVVPDAATRSQVLHRATTEVVLAADLDADDDSDPHVALDPDGAVYIFFTSGSTGAPKGTIVGHGMPFATMRLFDVHPDDNKAVISPLSFITGCLGATGTLFTGACAHLFDPTIDDVSEIPAWIVERQITIMSLSVTMIATIAKACIDEGRTLDSVRYLGHGGEAGSAQHFVEARRAFPNATFRHGFGMTETGSISGIIVDTDDLDLDGGPVPVGRPWPWFDVAVVDESGQPVPDGEAGEVWATGHGVALSYYDEPALTAERFLVHPDGRRTVRTGDRGRFRPDGMLEFLGRIDRRVKVHGQLVDLAQVEREVVQLRGVRNAVVSDVPTDDGGHRIVAHVVVDRSLPVTVGELRRGLADRLPPYAIPRAFFRIDDVPQTITGKVDRVRLRESSIGALPLETEYVAPRNEAERLVAHLFEEVLAVERVGVHDDFFELGGDSLSAIELLAGLAEELGLDLSAGDLLRHATVEAVAARLTQADHGGRGRRGRRGALVTRVNDGAGPAIFCVPGAADTPLQYRQLGRRLADVAVWAFSYRGIDHRAVPDQTVRAIARRNVREMLAVDAVGPHRLLGYSFGGMVALEMATQLEAGGHPVELLALLEPSLGDGHVDEPPAQLGPPGPAPESFVTRVHRNSLAAHPGDAPSARLARLGYFARAGARFALRPLYTASAGIVPRDGLAQHQVFLHFHGRVGRAHRSAPYGGRAVVVASPGYLALVRHELDRLLPPESAGGNRRDVAVAGEHLDLLREPNVAEVARALDLLVVPEPV